MENVEKRLQEIQGRADKATPGGWSVCGASEGRCRCGYVFGHDGECYVAMAVNHEYGDVDPYPNDEDFQANKQFIAHARQDIPFLLEQVKSKDGRIAELEDGLRWIPVGERLPGYGVNVLLTCGQNPWMARLEKARPRSSNKIRRTDHWDSSICLITWEPTHWMPLPEPPARNILTKEGKL